MCPVQARSPGSLGGADREVRFASSVAADEELPDGGSGGHVQRRESGLAAGGTGGGRHDARDRWGSLIATSGAYAHAALTALPGDGEDAGHCNMDSRTMQVTPPLAHERGGQAPDVRAAWVRAADA
jgi:hypothetical protein